MQSAPADCWQQPCSLPVLHPLRASDLCPREFRQQQAHTHAAIAQPGLWMQRSIPRPLQKKPDPWPECSTSRPRRVYDERPHMYRLVNPGSSRYRTASRDTSRPDDWQAMVESADGTTLACFRVTPAWPGPPDQCSRICEGFSWAPDFQSLAASMKIVAPDRSVHFLVWVMWVPEQRSSLVQTDLGCKGLYWSPAVVGRCSLLLRLGAKRLED